ncbi:MAG: hypothetical protein HFP81_09400 [Methylococcales symbiont of Hymedesmia sp. n. MRB-2018]|nr:MAG: hypothetical protein HFP81_09400 [Methylococcales symbiont of Hymedesmia sp. n. MRB-2018]
MNVAEASCESLKRFLARLTGEVTLAASLANLSVEASRSSPQNLSN